MPPGAMRASSRSTSCCPNALRCAGLSSRSTTHSRRQRCNTLQCLRLSGLARWPLPPPVSHSRSPAAVAALPLGAAALAWCAEGGSAHHTAGCPLHAHAPRRSSAPRTPSTTCRQSPSRVSSEKGGRRRIQGVPKGSLAGAQRLGITCQATRHTAGASPPPAARPV